MGFSSAIAHDSHLFLISPRLLFIVPISSRSSAIPPCRLGCALLNGGSKRRRATSLQGRGASLFFMLVLSGARGAMLQSSPSLARVLCRAANLLLCRKRTAAGALKRASRITPRLAAKKLFHYIRPRRYGSRLTPSGALDRQAVIDLRAARFSAAPSARFA